MAPPHRRTHDGELTKEATSRPVPSTPRTLAPVRRLLEEGVGRAYPGGVLAVLYQGELVIRWAVGLASHTPSRRRATATTVYDLASLTKVVVTTPLILQAVASGRLRLDDPLTVHLPEARQPGLTVRHLLTHTSGLPAWVPFYLEATGYDAIVGRAASTPAAPPPGTKVVYSDLGFILLGEVASRVLGAPLQILARDRIFRPLKMTRTRYLPPRAWRPRIAPTEDGTAIEQGMAGPAGRRHTWRQELIWGEVHDSTAHAMGGVSGHAGVFGTADDLVAYAAMWLAEGRGPRGEVLPRDLVREATRGQEPGALRGLGWALTGPQGWWGDALSPHAYGHTGFTGTALALDPELGLAIVFLTNAIHLGRDRTEILTLRPQIAAAVRRTLR